MRENITLLAFCSISLLPACSPRPTGADTGQSESSSQSDSAESSDSNATSTSSESESGDPDTNDTDTNDTNDTDASTTNDGDFIDIVECNMLMQDCPAGQKCMTYYGFSALTKCVPVLGDQQVGEPCTYETYEGTDDCDENSGCWDFAEPEGETRTGWCREFCSGSVRDPQCSDGFACEAFGDDVANAFCVPTCDPLQPNCQMGFGCHYQFTDGIFLCDPAGQAALGEACDSGSDSECVPAAICVLDELPNCAGAWCCTKYCDLQIGDADCAELPGTICDPFTDEPSQPEEVNLGTCVAPP